jgi:tRNA modification GTPase
MEDDPSILRDDIVATATPQGIGAISLIRVSGPNAIAIVSRFTDRPITDAPSRLAMFRRISVGGQILDETLITVFHGPFSYTGEDLVEISCHGSPYIVGRLLENLLLHARAAEPGEFTRRAFLSGRMDLLQAEAVGDLIAARTLHSHQAAVGQLERRLSHRIARQLERLSDLRARLELEIDFTEQELDETLDPGDLIDQVTGLLDELRSLAATGEEGMILRDGLKVGLAGAPNVGKSSLFNAFLQTERAIVTPIPGTTRDYLEEALSIDGYLVRLIDTAGIREADNPVEAIGVERTRDVLADCQVVLLMETDGQTTPELPQGITEDRVIRVAAKSDLLTPANLERARDRGFTPCSVVSPGGLDAVRAAILARIELPPDEGILTNARQAAAVRKGIDALEKALETANIDYGPELLAFDLAQASQALEEVIGKVTADDILERVFATFCIGK